MCPLSQIMNRISIIGLGWIGKPLAFHLQEKGVQVKGSTTSAEKQAKLSSLGLNAIRFSLNPHPEGVGFNALFQSEILVVNIPPRTRTGAGFFHLEQIKYIKSLMDNSPVQKVIFVSSTGVYPEVNSPEKYREEFLLSQENTGNQTIFKAEQMLSQDRKYDLTIIRFGGLLGDDRIPGKYFSGKENVAGHTRVNYIHRQDAVRLLFWIIKKDLWNEIFNGVAPIHPLRKDIYEKNATELGFAPPASYQNEREGNDRLIDSSKILETGFQFEFLNPLEFSYLPLGQLGNKKLY